jgi:hypothetical protein
MHNNLVAVPGNNKKISLKYKGRNGVTEFLFMTGVECVSFDNFSVKRDMQTHTTLAGEYQIAYDTIELIPSIAFELWGTPINYGKLAGSFANNISNIDATLIFSQEITFQNKLEREQFIFEGALVEVSPPKPEFKQMYNLKGSFLPTRITMKVNGIEKFKIDQELKRVF